MLDRPKTGVLENLNSRGRKLSSLPHEFMQQVQSFEKVIEEEIRANDEQGGVIAAIQNSFLDGSNFSRGPFRLIKSFNS